ncbi:DNA-processing protein DprA [Chitinibacteraceae bacterium HSL-7]
MADPHAPHHWLKLALVPGLGARKQQALLRGFGSPEAALFAGRQALRAHLDESVVDALQQVAAGGADGDVDAHLAWLAQAGNRMLTLADEDYPQALLELPDPPVVLFAKGDVSVLQHPALAVIGSRNATPIGLDHAFAFARALSDRGVVPVSGLAQGIDGGAHRGGLAGEAGTIAVVGTGLDRVYPAQHRELAHDIAQRGLLLSEFVLGTPPKREHFPRRNRLIAALSQGTLVVEAALGSGSLITARQAVELGRDVFAIPGSIHSPQSKGCHRLIKDGAKLVESVDDILQESAFSQALRAAPQAEPQINALPQPDPDAAHLLDVMGFEPVEFDGLVDRSGLTAERLCAILLALELEGVVVVLPGSRYQRRP